jgi:hypothetical protein
MKSVVLAPINKTFERRVRQLAKEGSEIVESYAELTSRMLAFAVSFKSATAEAARLDEGDEGVHSKYLKETLAAAVKTANESIWSRWNTIGTYANALSEYAGFLPPQRDSLYELALAVKEKKPIGRWIEREKITVDSSVRDLRALRHPKSSTGRKAFGERGRHLNATVTLCFKTYEDAAHILADLLMNNKQIEIRSHHAFAEAFKAEVGIDGFEKVKSRIK